MRIVATADLHGLLPEIPPCDLLLIAGDVTPVVDHSLDRQRAWMVSEFKDWLLSVPADAIVGIAGNHDFIAQEDPDLMHALPWRYLCDQSAEIMGFKIHGSPWTPTFFNWAFMEDPRELARRWQLIPDDVEILLTHGPPRGILDLTARGVTAGCISLRYSLRRFSDLRLHVFGHIHEHPGQCEINGVTFVNATHVNLGYDPIHPPTTIELSPKKGE